MLAPELSELYNNQKQRKESKYYVDWEMSAQEKQDFEPFKPAGFFRTREPTRIKSNPRAKMQLYLHTKHEPKEKEDFHVEREI